MASNNYLKYDALKIHYVALLQQLTCWHQHIAKAISILHREPLSKPVS